MFNRRVLPLVSFYSSRRRSVDQELKGTKQVLSSTEMLHFFAS